MTITKRGGVKRGVKWHRKYLFMAPMTNGVVMTEGRKCRRQQWRRHVYVVAS